VPPADQQPPRRVELKVAAANRHAVDIDRELSAGTRIENGVIAHPANEVIHAREVVVHALRCRGDEHVVLERPVIALDRALEPVEAGGPELREEGLEGREAFGANEVEATLAVLVDGDEPCVSQNQAIPAGLKEASERRS
jgi:hypothetical protein